MKDGAREWWSRSIHDGVNWLCGFKVYEHEQPNNTLHPPPGGRLGANFKRAFARRGDLLLYWSERYPADEGVGPKQAFILDLKQGDSKQVSEAASTVTKLSPYIPIQAVLCNIASAPGKPPAQTYPTRFHGNPVRT